MAAIPRFAGCAVENLPDFTANANQPILSLMVSSSRANGMETPDEVRFYINDVPIGTMTKTSTGFNKTDDTNIFALLVPTQNGGMYGLRIKGNLVALTDSNTDSDTELTEELDGGEDGDDE